MTIRVALLAGSPVHYQAPLYRRVAADPRIDFTAIYASGEGVRPFDGGYGRPVVLDTGLLEGYDAIFVRKAERNPSGGRVFTLRDYDVFNIVRRGQFDVLWLHGYHTVTHLLAALAQRMNGGALLYREDATLLHARPGWKRALKRIVLPLVFEGARGLYVGSENKRWFDHWGVPPERLFFTPWCVDNERLQRAAERLRPVRARVRTELGLPAETPVILNVSRLIPRKRTLFLLDAFKRVRARTACSLLIVGSGEVEAAARRKVETECIPDVVFAGVLDQARIAGAYAAADVFVLPSLGDPWGLVVNEAMNFELPLVVSSEVGSAPDLVREGENGFVFDAENVEALATTLERLVTDDGLRRRAGARSLELIRAWNYETATAGALAAIADAVGADRWAAAQQSRATEAA